MAARPCEPPPAMDTAANGAISRLLRTQVELSPLIHSVNLLEKPIQRRHARAPMMESADGLTQIPKMAQLQEHRQRRQIGLRDDATPGAIATQVVPPSLLKQFVGLHEHLARQVRP